MMKAEKFFIFFLGVLLSLPALAGAETLRLECNIDFNGLTDRYSIVINLESGEVHSTYHAAAIKDDKITIDFEVSSQARINKEQIAFEAKLHSLDYTFEINKTTLGITRYLNSSIDDVVGRGSCREVETSGKKL